MEQYLNDVCDITYMSELTPHLLTYLENIKKMNANKGAGLIHTYNLRRTRLPQAGVP
jgi:hypothetical protein